MNNDPVDQRKSEAAYHEVTPRFREFDERNDNCDECPFYREECSGEYGKRCFSADILELLDRGWTDEAKAEPVRHGRWNEPTGRFQDGFWVCSSCNFCSEATAAPILYKFCPNCGAKMDAEE